MKVNPQSNSQKVPAHTAPRTGHILPSKIKFPPIAPDILPRSRLINQLNKGHQRVMTLISAPAGYGKSTLASRWLSVCKYPKGWISLDQRDSDLRTFLTYISAAIRSMLPKIELKSEALIEANILPSFPVLVSYIQKDLNQIAESFILVLDDYHLIQGREVHDLLTELLTHPLPNMHLVLLTRCDPPLPISRLRARGQLLEIRAANLRFTLDETKAFFNKKLKIPLDDAAASLLEKKTEGWVTGLRLAGHYLRHNEDLSQRMKDISGNSKHITEYFLSEVLDKQDPQIITYLLETSLLDRFCVPLCQAVHGRGIKNPKALPDLDAEEFIQWLVKSNLFVTPLDDHGYWFRYHYMFQELLQIKLRKEVDANTINVLHMQASKWFAENYLIEEALQYALAAGNNQVAARLVTEYRYDLMNKAQYQRLNKWLALLPKDTVAESLPLVTARAIIAWVSGQHGDVATYTKQARRLLEALSPEFFEYGIFQGEILTLESVLNALSGQPLSFVDSQKAMELLPEEALFFRATAAAAMALSCQMKGDLEQGFSLLRDVLKAADLPISIQARVWFYLCIINYMDCNTPEIMISGHKVLELAKTSQLAHTTGVSQYLIGATHYLRNELKEAKTYLLGVLDDRAFTNPIYVTQACSVLGFIYLAEGFLEKAECVVTQAVDNAWEMQDHYSPSIRKALRVELALRRGMVDEARRLSIGVDFNIIPPTWYIYIPQLTHIKLLLAESTDEGLNQAHNRLVELGTKMRRVNRKCVLIDVLALDALVCRKLGKQKIALERLQEALALAEPGGWIRNFVDLGITMRDLLELLNQVYPGQKFTQQILDACRAEDKVNVLTKREIELLALLADGCNNKEIAERLFIAQETVKTHLQNIYSKLDVRGRLKVINKARSLGCIPQN